MNIAFDYNVGYKNLPTTLVIDIFYLALGHDIIYFWTSII